MDQQSPQLREFDKTYPIVDLYLEHQYNQKNLKICEVDIGVLKFATKRRQPGKLVNILFDTQSYTINMSNFKLNLFKKSKNCVGCGLVGEKLFLTKNHKNHFLLALFGIRDNQLVEMTLDHIISKSLGGPKYNLNNHQTMCCVCNQKKGAADWRAHQLALCFTNTILSRRSTHELLRYIDSHWQ